MRTPCAIPVWLVEVLIESAGRAVVTATIYVGSKSCHGCGRLIDPVHATHTDSDPSVSDGLPT